MTSFKLGPITISIFYTGFNIGEITPVAITVCSDWQSESRSGLITKHKPMIMDCRGKSPLADQVLRPTTPSTAFLVTFMKNVKNTFC